MLNIEIVKILFADIVVGYMEIVENRDLKDLSDDLKEYAKYCRINEIKFTIDGFHYWTQDKYELDFNTYLIKNNINKIVDCYNKKLTIYMKEIEITKI